MPQDMPIDLSVVLYHVQPTLTMSESIGRGLHFGKTLNGTTCLTLIISCDIIIKILLNILARIEIENKSKIIQSMVFILA